MCAARNLALQHCRTPLVAFLDSDDLWEPDKLESQLQLLSDQVQVVHSDFRYFRETGVRVSDPGQRPNNPAVGNCLTSLLAEDTVVFSSVLVRKELLDRVAAEESHGLVFDPRWTNGQDYDLLLRCARHTQFGYVARPVVNYRVHSGQHAMANLPRVFGFHCRVQIDFCERWAARSNLDPEMGRSAAREFLYGRTASLYWQRSLAPIPALCDLAVELGLSDDRFVRLRRMAKRPRWILRLRDAFDRLF